MASFARDFQKVLSDPENIKTLHSISVGYYISLAFGGAYACIFIAHPLLYKNNDDQSFRNSFLAIYLVFNMMGNFVLGSVNPSTYSDGILLDHPPKSWRLCMTCKQHCPPRSHHCVICNTCILKRDHHCYFFRSCIGVRNLRYFIPYSLYVGLSAFFSIKQMVFFLHATYVPFELSAYSVFSYLFPGFIYNWICSGAGNIDIYIFICFMVLYGALTTGFASFFFFIFEFVLILKGQTAYEFAKDIRRYDQGKWKNFTTVFGSYGILYFFLPLPFKSKEENSNWGYPKFVKGI